MRRGWKIKVMLKSWVISIDWQLQEQTKALSTFVFILLKICEPYVRDAYNGWWLLSLSRYHTLVQRNYPQRRSAWYNMAVQQNCNWKKCNSLNSYDNPCKFPSYNPMKAIQFCGHVVLLAILQCYISIDGLTHLHKMTREKYERDSKLSVSVSYMLINLCVTISHCRLSVHLLLLNRGEHQTLVPQP